MFHDFIGGGSKMPVSQAQQVWEMMSLAEALTQQVQGAIVPESRNKEVNLSVSCVKMRRTRIPTCLHTTSPFVETKEALWRLMCETRRKRQIERHERQLMEKEVQCPHKKGMSMGRSAH